MNIAASYAIADVVGPDELSADYIMPDPFDERIARAVAEAVGKAAKETNVSRL